MQQPETMRMKIREGEWQQPTSGLLPSYIQTNVVILPETYASAFKTFAKNNPKSCPVLEELPAGQYTSRLARNSDMRTDVPLYRCFEHGEFSKQVSDIKDLWREDFVTFLIGCSFTFESALLEAGIPLRHIEENKNVAMYKTNIPTIPSPPFEGSMVVSMRPIPNRFVDEVVKITQKFPSVHGSPIHIGNPEEIGISRLQEPDYGNSIDIREDETPVFWACGVTPQIAIWNAKPSIAITHEPGHMFITDKKHEEYKVE